MSVILWTYDFRIRSLDAGANVLHAWKPGPLVGTDVGPPTYEAIYLERELVNFDITPFLAGYRAHLSVKLDAVNTKITPATTGSVAAPAAGASVALAGAGAGNLNNGLYKYAVSFLYTATESGISPITTVTVVDKTTNGQVAITAIPTGGVGCTDRNLYRTTAGGTALKLLHAMGDNTTATYTDNIADGSLGAAPAGNTYADLETVLADLATSGNTIQVALNATDWKTCNLESEVTYAKSDGKNVVCHVELGFIAKSLQATAPSPGASAW